MEFVPLLLLLLLDLLLIYLCHVFLSHSGLSWVLTAELLYGNCKISLSVTFSREDAFPAARSIQIKRRVNRFNRYKICKWNCSAYSKPMTSHALGGL